MLRDSAFADCGCLALAEGRRGSQHVWGAGQCRACEQVWLCPAQQPVYCRASGQSSCAAGGREHRGPKKYAASEQVSETGEVGAAVWYLHIWVYDNQCLAAVSSADSGSI